MTVLLDTQIVLWAALDPERLTRRVRAILLETANEILVSAASAWEIATKVRIGKMPEAVEFEREFLNDMHRAGYRLLAIDATIALHAGRLPGNHGDPFDRMIAAHALALDVDVVSIDKQLDAFGVRRIW